MTLLDSCPTPPDWRLAWDALLDEYGMLRELYDCPQDPIHHAEGDVGTHTRVTLLRTDVARGFIDFARVGS